MDEIKIWLGAMITVILVFLALAICSDYDIDTYTGNNIGPVLVHETQTVEVESETSFNLTLTSCSPFTIKVDGEIEFKGHPENIGGTECSTSYYKYEKQVKISSFEVTAGSPELSISSEIPTGITVAYPEDTRQDVIGTTTVATFWIWFFLMLLIVSL